MADSSAPWVALKQTIGDPEEQSSQRSKFYRLESTYMTDDKTRRTIKPEIQIL